MHRLSSHLQTPCHFLPCLDGPSLRPSYRLFSTQFRSEPPLLQAPEPEDKSENNQEPFRYCYSLLDDPTVVYDFVNETVVL